MTTASARKTTVKAAVERAAKRRRRRDLEDLDYRRALREVRLVTQREGYAQRAVADALGISQPALSKALRSTEAVPEPPEGFSGASPYEICERYDAGFIQRDQLIDELTRWNYGAQGSTDGYDSLMVDDPGSWTDVEMAFRRDLIDRGIYEEVFNQLMGR